MEGSSGPRKEEWSKFEDEFSKHACKFIWREKWYHVYHGEYVGVTL